MLFFCTLWIKPNLIKSEIPGIGLLKGVQVAVCGMLCVYLNNDLLLLQCKIKREKIYKTVIDI